MEPVAGGLLAPLLVGATAMCNYIRITYGMTANYWAIGIHIVCWLLQFVGHGKFEGRAPALLDNIVQAVFLAPFFVWFELLFMLGYRPELKRRIDKAVEQEIAAFKADKGPNGIKSE
jgi:2-hydroxy fatty acid dioxygenase